MRVETVVHSSGDLLPILLDDDGLPIPSPNEFVMGRRNLAQIPSLKQLRELSVLSMVFQRSSDLTYALETKKKRCAFLGS